MEARRWISGRWVEKAGQRRRRHYRITDAGTKVLASQRADWARFVAALGQVAGVRYA
jgi:DNA-binding PadR family transcriptional regulator